MQLLAVRYDLQLHDPHSLKEKRAILRPLLDRLRATEASVSEVAHHDLWQRAAIGIALVGPDAAHVTDLADGIDRLIWSRPDIDVLDADRRWLEWE